MPVKHCVVCNETYELPRDVYRYIHHKEAFVCSKRCVQGWISNHACCDDWNWRHKYPYPGFVTDGLHTVYSEQFRAWFGSKYEVQVATWLTEVGFKWYHEEVGFPLGRQRYTPDFFLPSHDVFLEVKGAWVHGKRKKMDTFRQLYPATELLVVPWLLASDFDPIPVKEVACHFVKC